MKAASGFLIGLFLLFSVPVVYGQSAPQTLNRGIFWGGVGFSRIDDQTYFTLMLRPEVTIGKVGIGLNIPLRFDTETGSLRDEDWQGSYSYLRVIRYARYGYKRDPFYTRVGELDATRIGHGFIMNYYSNSMINYDGRKVGLVLDIDAGIAGFESMTSNLGRAEIFGGRAFYRPLYESSTPILRHFAVGGSIVTDIDPDQFRATSDGVTIFGADIEVPVIKTPILQTLLYADYAKISGNGDGKAVGIEVTAGRLLNLFHITAQFERRFLGERFLPNYFNAFYELDRFNVIDDTTIVRKKDLLAGQQKARGFFGLLYGDVLGLMQLTGTFEKLDAVPNSGILHAEAVLPNTIPGFSARAIYDRTGIGSFSDAFKLDNRSIARLGLGYKLNAFTVLYLDYIWTYKIEADGRRTTQRRFEPQVTFVYPFTFGR